MKTVCSYHGALINATSTALLQVVCTILLAAVHRHIYFTSGERYVIYYMLWRPRWDLLNKVVLGLNKFDKNSIFLPRREIMRHPATIPGTHWPCKQGNFISMLPVWLAVIWHLSGHHSKAVMRGVPSTELLWSPSDSPTTSGPTGMLNLPILSSLLLIYQTLDTRICSNFWRRTNYKQVFPVQKIRLCQLGRIFFSTQLRPDPITVQ
jgi:hypothetical protein